MVQLLAKHVSKNAIWILLLVSENQKVFLVSMPQYKWDRI